MYLLLCIIQMLRCLFHSLRTVRLSRFKARIRPQAAVHRKRNKPQWVVREIIRLKALTNLSTRKLADTFNRRYAASKHITISKSTVATIIRTHQAEILQLRQRWKRRIPAPLPRNHIWGMDITGKMDTQGHIHPILGIIDHSSRLALTLQPLTDKTSLTLLKALIIGIETFGMPRILRTDNEAVFTSRLFRLGLRMLGITHQRSQPGCPWQNGRIERLFGTLKQKLNQIHIPDFNDLTQAMLEFRTWYNAVRPHQHLGGLTPSEAWFGINPYQTPAKESHLFIAWDGLLTGLYLRR